MGNHKESSHWISQRLSALALVPLGMFSTYNILTILAEKSSILNLINSPISLICIILFTIFAFYHAQLGFEVIFDDYVSCNCKKHLLNGLIKFINIATVLFFIFAAYVAFQRQDITGSTEVEGEIDIKIQKQIVEDASH